MPDAILKIGGGVEGVQSNGVKGGVAEQMALLFRQSSCENAPQRSDSVEDDPLGTVQTLVFRNYQIAQYVIMFAEKYRAYRFGEQKGE